MKGLQLIVLIFITAGCAVQKNTKPSHPYQGHVIGCGDFIVYQMTKSNTEYVSVAFNAKKVDLVDFQAYGVGKTDVLEIKRRKYKESISAALCNDIMVDKPELLVEESPRQGVVEILISEDERKKAVNNQGYRVTIVLKKVLFDTAVIDYLRIEDVYVGWLPG